MDRVRRTSSILTKIGWIAIKEAARAQESNPETNPLLTEVRIPAKKRADFLRALERHATSFRTLFPDLTGLWMHLNWKHRLV